MFEKAVEIGILFDFYGKLLSDKQYSAIELYYIHDLSLSEIGEQLNISRQGVFDILKRAESHLYMYEKKLGLVEKFNSNNKKVREILEYIDRIKDSVYSLNNDEISNHIEEIRSIVLDILEINQEGK